MRGKWVLAAVPIALAVGCGSSNGPGSVAGDEGVIQSQQATPAATPTSTLADDLYSWGHGGGLAQIQALSTALGDISAAAPNGTDAIAAACEKLTVAVTGAEAYPPIPDPTIQAHWAAALSDFNNSANDCATGAANVDVATIQKAVTESNEGTDELQAATSEVNASH